MDEQAILKKLRRGSTRDVEDPYWFECRMFFQAIDLGEIDHITVDGVDYPLN